jgi:hypothetical protein
LTTTESVSPTDRLITLPQGVPDLTLGWEAAKWAMRWLVQPNGPKAGQPWRPTDGQMRFLLWWYALDESGRWLFHHGARRMAKGSGKSPFAAVLSLIEFCAPVRLKDFAPKLPGGCVGVPVDMPLILIAATAESQTSNTMRMVRAFAPKRSDLVKHYDLDPGKTQYYRQPEGELKVITSSYTAAEGAEPTFQVGDETEYWKPANGGIDLFDTLVDNATKSGTRLLETSNAWKPGEESVAEHTWDAWVAQEEGLHRADTKILYDARMAPPDTKPDANNPSSLRAALEFVYADCEWQDLEPIMQRFWSKNSRPDENQRKYLNWPTVSEDAWVEPVDWTKLGPAHYEKHREPDDSDFPEVQDGDWVVLFFDGSKSRDATALVGCRMSDGHVFTLGVWEPDPAHDADETVDANAVDFAVRRAFDRFDVAAFFADVREWESWVLTEWPNRYKDDLKIHAAPNARPPQPIAWDMRGHSYEFAKAVEACRTEILEGEFTHDGHPAVARHIGNARTKDYRDAQTIGKESPSSPRKIDAAVCVVGARMVRRIVLGKGLRQRSGKAAF